MGSKRKSDPVSSIETDGVDPSEEDAQGLTAEQRSLLEDYQIFLTGQGLNVLEDLTETFYDLHSPGMNEQLDEIPHPYQEYTIKGMRMVIQKIKDTIKLSQNQEK